MKLICSLKVFIHAWIRNCVVFFRLSRSPPRSCYLRIGNTGSPSEGTCGSSRSAFPCWSWCLMIGLAWLIGRSFFFSLRLRVLVHWVNVNIKTFRCGLAWSFLDYWNARWKTSSSSSVQLLSGCSLGGRKGHRTFGQSRWWFWRQRSGFDCCSWVFLFSGECDLFRFFYVCFFDPFPPAVNGFTGTTGSVVTQDHLDLG